MPERARERVVIIGAGPAGLSAAYTLTKRAPERFDVTVLEAHSHLVGGISRTEEYKGFHFDIGGHRFFSKSPEIEALWSELLPEDLLERHRSSRIFYDGKLFRYPLEGAEALWKLGPFEAARCLASYAKARLFPKRSPKSFEDWVSNQFGERLFHIFFKTYTEKVWGMSCAEISADWAAQRIEGLSLAKAIMNAFKPAPRGSIKTLIDSFRYPRKGPGMLWTAAAEKVRAQGGKVLLDQRVRGLSSHGSDWTVRTDRGSFEAEHVISSAPLRELVEAISPPLSEPTRRAARALRYRDFITVVLIVRDTHRFDDNWIYVHDPAVKVGRIQNFKAWSAEMVPDPAKSGLGMEYFCHEGDGLWASSDAELIALATRELAHLGLARAREVLEGRVVRQLKAYPVYDDGYAARVATIRDELEARFSGLHLAGRNGMHKYDNQDQAMMSAILCAENIMLGRRAHDVWRVTDTDDFRRLVPERVK